MRSPAPIYYICKSSESSKLKNYSSVNNTSSSWKYYCHNDSVDFYADNVTTKLLYNYKLVPYIAAISVVDKTIIGSRKNNDNNPYCCLKFLICFKPEDAKIPDSNVLSYEDKEIIDTIKKQLSFDITLRSKMTQIYASNYYEFRLNINKHSYQPLLLQDFKIDFNLKDSLDCIIHDDSMCQNMQYSISCSLYIPVTICNNYFEEIKYQEYEKYSTGQCNGDIIIDQDTNIYYIIPNTTNKNFIINVHSEDTNLMPIMLQYLFRIYCDNKSQILFEILANRYKSLSSNCVDCIDCIKCNNCTNCNSCESCFICTDCMMCYKCKNCYTCSCTNNCTDCKNCFSCINLNNEINKIYENVKMYDFDSTKQKIKYCIYTCNDLLSKCGKCNLFFNDLYHNITDNDKKLFNQIKNNYDKLIKCYTDLVDYSKTIDPNTPDSYSINELNKCVDLLNQYLQQCSIQCIEK